MLDLGILYLNREFWLALGTRLVDITRRVLLLRGKKADKFNIFRNLLCFLASHFEIEPNSLYLNRGF